MHRQAGQGLLLSLKTILVIIPIHTIRYAMHSSFNYVAIKQFMLLLTGMATEGKQWWGHQTDLPSFQSGALFKGLLLRLH